MADALKRAADGIISPREAVKEYEAEMRLRGKEAVEVSHLAWMRTTITRSTPRAASLCSERRRFEVGTVDGLS